MYSPSLRRSTGGPRSYLKSVLKICVYVLGRLRDLQYIFAVTSGSPSISYGWFVGVGHNAYGGDRHGLRHAGGGEGERPTVLQQLCYPRETTSHTNIIKQL